MCFSHTYDYITKIIQNKYLGGKAVFKKKNEIYMCFNHSKNFQKLRMWKNHLFMWKSHRPIIFTI